VTTPIGTLRALPNADGSVRWGLLIRRNGKAETIRCTQYHREEDRPLVEMWAEEIREHLRNGASKAPKADETFAAWHARYLVWRSGRIVGGEDVDTSRGRVRKWVLPRIGHRPIASITRAELESLVGWLDRAIRDGDLAAKTARNVWAECTAAFGVAASAKRDTGLRVRDDDPSDGIAPPEKGLEASGQILRPAELVALLSCPDVPIGRRHVYAVGAYTAMRQGEIRGLRVRDIDLDARRINVTRQNKNGKEKERTKMGRARVVQIEPHLYPLLAALCEGRSPDAVLVHVSRDNRCAALLRKDLKKAKVTRAELFKSTDTTRQINFHMLRNTCGVHMALRGDSPHEVQWRMGHATAVMTENYIAEARYEAGPNFGTPLPPLPVELIEGSDSERLATGGDESPRTITMPLAKTARKAVKTGAILRNSNPASPTRSRSRGELRFPPRAPPGAARARFARRSLGARGLAAGHPLGGALRAAGRRRR